MPHTTNDLPAQPELETYERILFKGCINTAHIYTVTREGIPQFLIIPPTFGYRFYRIEAQNELGECSQIATAYCTNDPGDPSIRLRFCHSAVLRDFVPMVDRSELRDTIVDAIISDFTCVETTLTDGWNPLT